MKMGFMELQNCFKAGKPELPSHHLQSRLKAEPEGTKLDDLPSSAASGWLPASWAPDPGPGPSLLPPFDCLGSWSAQIAFGPGGALGALLHSLLVSLPPSTSPALRLAHGPKAILRCRGTLIWERVMAEPRKSLQQGGGRVDRAASAVAGHQPTSPSSEQIKEASSSYPSRDRLAPGRARHGRKMKFPRTTV